MDVGLLASKYLDGIVRLRRDLHMHPELSEQEERTSRVVQEELKSLGIPFRVLAGHGVLGTIDSGRPGKTVALRADMDALAVHEE